MKAKFLLCVAIVLSLFVAGGAEESVETETEPAVLSPESEAPHEPYEFFQKKPIKDLKSFLASRGLECKGCSEKSDYVKMAFESQGLQVQSDVNTSQSTNPEKPADPNPEELEDIMRKMQENGFGGSFFRAGDFDGLTAEQIAAKMRTKNSPPKEKKGKKEKSKPADSKSKKKKEEDSESSAKSKKDKKDKKENKDKKDKKENKDKKGESKSRAKESSKTGKESKAEKSRSKTGNSASDEPGVSDVETAPRSEQPEANADGQSRAEPKEAEDSSRESKEQPRSSSKGKEKAKESKKSKKHHNKEDQPSWTSKPQHTPRHQEERNFDDADTIEL